MSPEQRSRLTASERRRLVVVGVVSGLFFGIAMGCLFGLVNGSPFGIAALSGAVAGTIFGSGMAVLTARAWRENGGLSSASTMQRALKSRRLPDDADAEVWLPLLDKQERAVGRWKFYVLFCAGVTVLYLVIAVSGRMPELGPLPWIGVFLFAGVGIYAPFEARARRLRIRALREQLAAPV